MTEDTPPVEAAADTTTPMRLRTEPPRVTRLSRKMLAGVGAVALLGIGGARSRLAMQGREAKNSIRPRTGPRRTACPACRAIIPARSSDRHCPAIWAARSSTRRTGASQLRRRLWQHQFAILPRSAASPKRKLHVSARCFSSPGRERQQPPVPIYRALQVLASAVSQPRETGIRPFSMARWIGRRSPWIASWLRHRPTSFRPGPLSRRR